MSDTTVVLLIFIAIFIGIISEKLDKTILVLIGASVIIGFGYIHFTEAMHAIDFDTVILLLGMMLLVDSMRDLQIFDWVALKLGIMTRGNPVLIFTMFSLATATLSAFLDNVTTVLIIAPLIIQLTKGIGLPPKPFLFSVIFLSNVGGAATLIGDPPNILIGSQVEGLTFASFLQFLSFPVIATSIIALLMIKHAKKDIIKPRNSTFDWLFMSSLMLEQMKRELDELKIPKPVFVKSMTIFGLVILGFFLHAVTHMEPAVVAISGATVMMVAFHKELDPHHLIPKIEWPTLVFFSGLFVVVGAMEHVGVLELIAHQLVGVTDNLLVMLMLIIWSSAILSAIVDNIPFVAVMIPILKDLIKSDQFANHPKTYLVWWALALGACFGGNGSMIGASANVVSCAIAKSKGIDIGFKEFMKEALPVTIMSIVVSSLYLIGLYYY